MTDWGDDDWGVTSPSVVPLPNDDMHFGFGTPAVSANVSAVKNNYAVVSSYEVAANTPAASPDAADDWRDVTSAPATKAAVNDDIDLEGDALGVAQAVNRDSCFGDDGFGFDYGEGGFGGGVSAGLGEDDPFGCASAGVDYMDLVSTRLTTKDASNALAESSTKPARSPKSKRIIRPDLIPDKTRDKGFHEYFIAELSELYDDGDPKDTRDIPLRRQEDYYVFAKELAASARAGATRPQVDTEKKSKKKSHIHYNGDRKTTNYTWEDFEIRLLLCIIIRGIHISGTPGSTDRWSKRRIMESRRSLNDSLPKATDGHTHRGQWAYHDVAKLLNFHTSDEIPVVDVRDMIHRLVDQRKGALILANRAHAPRMTMTIAMAWKRQQDFVGDLKEWYGEKSKEGRKARLERLDRDKNEVAHEFAQNRLQQVGCEPGIDASKLGQTYTQEVAQGNASGDGDHFADNIDGFGDRSVPAQSADGYDDWGSGDDLAVPPAAQLAENSFAGFGSASPFNDVAMTEASDEGWGDENVFPSAPVTSNKATLPGVNAAAFPYDMMANTSIASQSAAHQSDGFPIVDASRKDFTSVHIPPASAPGESLNIVSVAGLKAERLAMLSRQDMPPSKFSKKKVGNARGFSSATGGQMFRPANAGGVARSNAMPLALNRLDGQRFKPNIVPTSAPRLASGGSDDLIDDDVFGNGGRGGSGGPVPVSSDSMRTKVGGGNDGWGDTKPAHPAKNGHVDLDAASDDAWGGSELDF